MKWVHPNRQMRDRMPVAVKDAHEGSPLEPALRVTGVRCDDGPVKNLAAGQVGVQVDVGGQDEVLEVVFGSLAQQHQVFGRSDLVRLVRLSGAAAVSGLGSRNDGKKKNDGRYASWESVHGGHIISPT